MIQLKIELSRISPIQNDTQRELRERFVSRFVVHLSLQLQQ